jgi:hypothetical protein
MGDALANKDSSFAIIQKLTIFLNYIISPYIINYLALLDFIPAQAPYEMIRVISLTTFQDIPAYENAS